MIRSPALLLSALLAAGCVTQPEYEPDPQGATRLETAPRAVRPRSVSLGDWQVPEQFGGDYVLQGSMVSADGQARLLQYIADDRQFRIALYPLPGGWESFSPDRAVAGHFTQVQQQEVDRMTRDGAQTTRISDQAVIERHRAWPIAQVRLTGHFSDGDKLTRQVMLTGNGRVFIRAFHEPAGEDQIVEIRELLQRFVSQLKPPAPTPPKPTR